ncbi:hypothetical protein G7Z17_g195 [Cylindrodendrum hubeiense]|uniref:NACHT domain-containing protein n=1 Tax=Cylindrodendrum hubeiense TaxID=595255 RepID=A0A9P5HLK3_9HYPO|nr:hypothetical protein G7Z17_g195 [Cylindrodendrum hubeiense]
MAPQWQGVRLEQVNTTEASEGVPDVDIIAVHGLDTKSPDTWIWQDRDKPNTNWLADSHMLPAQVQRTRIFTCDWPADLIQDSHSITWRIEELAVCLLAGIQTMRLTSAKNGLEHPPILFIASCLGGLILMKALLIADNVQSDYISLRKATRGIVFLATPFRGTAFQDIANWSLPVLKTWTWLRNKAVTQLVDNVKGSTFDLEELVRMFSQLCQDKDYPCEAFTFYETGGTTLHRRLVDRSSATLDIVTNPLPLKRPHVTMNKFWGLEDPDFKLVVGKVQALLKIIREKRPLEQPDAWIRKNHYTADNLKIERLSGKRLPMDQCYINLAIIEQPGNRADHSRTTQSSPFSLLARQRVLAPNEAIQVQLATIFSQRQGPDARPIHPRRILIRGRAGVGKTTLCKKIVYEFTHGTQTELHSTWTGLFDRLLWLPLRNLKGRSAESYNHENLFYDEYFFAHGIDDGHRLAKELWQAVRDTNSQKTLFLLDGLDEVFQYLSGNGAMTSFLKLLLNEPNVIITSRPNASLPLGLQTPDVELETIGFYPDQVKAYINADPSMKPRSDEVLSFIQKHWLIQGLVRIPIQLDALCYTWEDFDTKTMPNTMTGIYEAITQKLWKKDAMRLGMPGSYAQSAHPTEIQGFVKNEIALIENLAFNGLRSDIIDFTSELRAKLVNMIPLPILTRDEMMSLDERLARLSFLRTTDSLSNAEDRNYHFIHLTFQEYFAARYFVRQWQDAKPLEHLFSNRENMDDDIVTDPKVFLQKHKYTARYDILWRFAAGLFDAVGQANEFIDIIEEEPLDILGPTHQRLT